jgi:transcriptional regulator with XRE-family HTH domain
LKLKITDFDVYGKIKHQTQLFLHDGGQHTMIELKTFEDVFGYRLRELRGKLTQKQLADILDTDPQTVQRWESGKLIPQASTRAYIAEKLKVAETSLFLDPDLTKPSDEQILAKITEKFGEKPLSAVPAIDPFQGLTETNKREVVALIRRLVSKQVLHDSKGEKEDA